MTLYVLYDKRDSMASSPRTKGFCFLCFKKTHTNECPEEAFPSDHAGSQVSRVLERAVSDSVRFLLLLSCFDFYIDLHFAHL